MPHASGRRKVLCRRWLSNSPVQAARYSKVSQPHGVDVAGDDEGIRLAVHQTEVHRGVQRVWITVLEHPREFGSPILGLTVAIVLSTALLVNLRLAAGGRREFPAPLNLHARAAAAPHLSMSLGVMSDPHSKRDTFAAIHTSRLPLHSPHLVSVSIRALEA